MRALRRMQRISGFRPSAVYLDDLRNCACPDRVRGRYLLTRIRSSMTRQQINRPSPTALASTAGALVALVAVAAMMTTTVVATPTCSGEVRQTINEGAKVRAAVAAVAAAARQLVDGHRLTQALPARWPAMVVVADSRTSNDRARAAAVPSPLLVLCEPILDLPPPAC